ncbi:hypothetical protein WR25_09241 [Diploscapter pachys]|uniref:Uncharacterized protein n=1 Tax=Diploscapter pachys TaxID=2018661 RepID=A0A2A2M3J5_9BILA|nr:hypothetical protein WR25_09241 [Diploscapter pachys]
MGHQDATQRPGQVTGDEYPEALQQTQPFRHLGREKQLAEDQSKEHENDEIVDFQSATQRGQPQGPVVATAEPWRACGIERSHGSFRNVAKGQENSKSLGPVAVRASGVAAEHRLREVGAPPRGVRNPCQTRRQGQLPNQYRQIDDRHEGLQRLAVRRVWQADADRMPVTRRHRRYLQVRRVIQQRVLDLRTDPAEARQVDPCMAGQLDVAHQKVERLQGAVHQALQVFERLHRSDPVVTQAVEHPLQLQALAGMLVGNEDAHGFVRHRPDLGSWMVTVAP